jgi:hypothetical protein
MSGAERAKEATLLDHEFAGFCFVALIPSGFKHCKALRSVHAKANNGTHEAAQ